MQRVSGVARDGRAVSAAGTISARVVVRIVDFVAARGHDAEALCRASGASLQTLRAVDARVPYGVAEALGRRATEITRDPNIGLHLAQDVRDTRVYDAGLLMLMASPSLRAGLEWVERHQRYWGDGERYSLVPVPGGTVVRFALHDAEGDYQRHADECAMAEIAVGARALSARDVLPRAVRFRHASPADTSEHVTVFGCVPEFGAPHTEIELDDEVLDAPLPHANAAFRAIFQAQVDRALAALPARSGMAAPVRAAVQAALVGGQCSLARTASVLGVSVRTLQRRLRDEGTSFEQVVDALRREMAAEYLDKELAIQEIAWLLGYAEASAFHHAFKRWTGTTPEQARALRTARSAAE
jgi:AraC-like DNA-binding protein